MEKKELLKKTKQELLDLAASLGLEIAEDMSKSQIVDELVKDLPQNSEEALSQETSDQEAPEEPIMASKEMDSQEEDNLKKIEMELQLRKSRWETGREDCLSKIGTEEAFQREIARRSNRYGGVASTLNPESAFQQEIERRKKGK